MSGQDQKRSPLLSEREYAAIRDIIEAELRKLGGYKFGIQTALARALKVNQQNLHKYFNEDGYIGPDVAQQIARRRGYESVGHLAYGQTEAPGSRVHVVDSRYPNRAKILNTPLGMLLPDEVVDDLNHIQCKGDGDKSEADWLQDALTLWRAHILRMPPGEPMPQKAIAGARPTLPHKRRK